MCVCQYCGATIPPVGDMPTDQHPCITACLETMAGRIHALELLAESQECELAGVMDCVKQLQVALRQHDYGTALRQDSESGIPQGTVKRAKAGR